MSTSLFLVWAGENACRMRGNKNVLVGGVFPTIVGYVEHETTKQAHCVTLHDPAMAAQQTSSGAVIWLPPDDQFKEPSADKPEGEKWEDSEAKRILYEALLEGLISDDLFPRQVHQMNAEFLRWPKTSFASNLRNLRAAVKRDQGRADMAKEAFEHDRRVMIPPATRKYPKWGGSEAEALLKSDIANKVIDGMKPKDIHEMRQEYQEWPLNVFRDFLTSTKRRRHASSYWLVRNKKKKNNKSYDPTDVFDEDDFNDNYDFVGQQDTNGAEGNATANENNNGEHDYSAEYASRNEHQTFI